MSANDFAPESAQDRALSIESHGSTEAPHGSSEIQTPYMVMSIRANQARPWYNIWAAVFSWLTLAGYVVFPNTFTSLQRSDSLNGSEGGRMIQNTVRNLPLLPLASTSCLVGISGTCWLWRKWRTNYIWLLGRIFMPGIFNSLIGLLTTVMSILSTQGRHFSITAIITITIVTSWGVTMTTLAIVYDRFLDQIITEHDRELVGNGEP